MQVALIVAGVILRFLESGRIASGDFVKQQEQPFLIKSGNFILIYSIAEIGLVTLFCCTACCCGIISSAIKTNKEKEEEEGDIELFECAKDDNKT